MESDGRQSPAVAVVGIVGGISIAVVVIFAIFVRDQMAIAAWIVSVLALMGVIVAPLAGRRK
jgi:CDP-diglyceride synthetase